MSPLHKRSILIAHVLLAAITLHAATRKVLFIGNSYIYTNNMPLMLQTLAANLGDTLVYDQSDPGGYTLAQHSIYAATISKIFSQQWDIVVLQEQSELPSFPPAEVDTEVYPYAHKLDSMIHANDTCTQTMFLMTWGHADGDPPNCASYPVICSYDGMQQRLRESYMQMTQDNSAIVAPAGVAWKEMRDSFPALWLYQADSIHPVIPGSYLETCVLYSSIFHKKTFGCSYTAGLTTTDAHTLQHVADKVVFDSLSLWQQYGHYPNAIFNYGQMGNAVTFSFVPVVFGNYAWSYGDGTTDTVTNPVHLYSTNGTYLVSHTAVTNCFSETITDTLYIGNTGTNTTANSNSSPVSVALSGQGNVTFILPAEHLYDILEVYDGSGKLIRRYPLGNRMITDIFAGGCYLYRAFSRSGKASYCNKLIVY